MFLKGEQTERSREVGWSNLFWLFHLVLVLAPCCLSPLVFFLSSVSSYVCSVDLPCFCGPISGCTGYFYWVGLLCLFGPYVFFLVFCYNGPLWVVTWACMCLFGLLYFVWLVVIWFFVVWTRYEPLFSGLLDLTDFFFAYMSDFVFVELSCFYWLIIWQIWSCKICQQSTSHPLLKFLEKTMVPWISFVNGRETFLSLENPLFCRKIHCFVGRNRSVGVCCNHIGICLLYFLPIR